MNKEKEKHLTTFSRVQLNTTHASFIYNILAAEQN